VQANILSHATLRNPAAVFLRLSTERAAAGGITSASALLKFTVVDQWQDRGSYMRTIHGCGAVYTATNRRWGLVLLPRAHLNSSRHAFLVKGRLVLRVEVTITGWTTACAAQHNLSSGKP